MACVVFGAAMTSGAAWAEDGGIPPSYLVTGDESPIAAYVAAARCDCASDAKDIGDSVDTSTLADMSGGTEIIQNTSLTGTVSNDSADHVISGYNLITGGSLAGEAGIPVVIQNSGSNVLIQNATVLTVQFKP
ncbi:hypothetical protein DVT68_13430 [Dyella solisilvae]|uniref:Type 1 fimbrial protein n=2 Tax=Dyella solisilvae TaxID=1920168 RepID=A0A370K601_9GAMM|nr:hypothetical protein DVT68_13430 [Dyella solisilvae]